MADFSISMTTWTALSPLCYFEIHNLPESCKASFSLGIQIYIVQDWTSPEILLNSLSILKLQRLEIPNLCWGQMQSAALSQRVEVFSPIKKLQQALWLILYAEIPLLTCKCWLSLKFHKFLAHYYLQVLNVVELAKFLLTTACHLTSSQ